jgi:serine/threonine protein kinase
MTCNTCGAHVLDIDVKCATCGAALAASGAHRMLGQLVLGTYELMDVIGQGGMSVVFKAKHKMTDQEVALKILPPELAAHSQVKSRFLDEAKALAALDHPNIVHLYNFGQENGSFVLAMQFVQGHTWERLILARKRLDWSSSARIAIDVLKALEYAHGRGVIHRDMKPSNVLVRAHDGLATVMDFGIAKMTTSTRLTATGQTMGTVRYMSPEQVRGQEVDLRTDIYSLGASLYESVTGETPFDGQTHFEIMTKHLTEPLRKPSDVGIELPAAIEEALVRAMAKKPDDRWPTARDMRKLLEAALRAGDVSLVETQRVQRELLSEVSEVRPRAQTPQPRAATPLADQLEPGTSAQPAMRRARWPWVVAALFVLGGAAAGAVFLLSDTTPSQPKHPPPVEAELKIPGVALQPPVQFDKPHVSVATDGAVDARAVADAYAEALSQLRAYAAKELPGLAIADPIDHIVAVPQTALCVPTLYLGNQAPEACRTIPAAVTDAVPRTLAVVADAQRLRAAMRKGLADAVCEYQPVEDPDPKKRQDRIAEICIKTNGFLKGPETAPPR